MSPTLIQIILLGLIQGAAELLPVSSSAHVIVAEKFMRLDPSSPEMTFLIVALHTGTMFAMIAYFWAAWKRTFFSSRAAFATAAGGVAAATVATLVVGYVLKVIIEKGVMGGRPGAAVEDLFSNLYLIAASLAVAGAVIVAAGLRSRPGSTGPAEAPPSGAAVPTGAALWIGVAQGLCLPFRGLSRSGTTISAGMLLGVPRRASEEFSFALAVVITPPVIARELLRLVKARAQDAGRVHLEPLLMPGIIGMACSFGAGLVALRWLSGWLENGRWHYFGFYCFAAAAAVCALARMGF